MPTQQFQQQEQGYHQRRRTLPELKPYVVYAGDDMARAFQVSALPGWPFLNYWVEYPPVFPFLAELLYRSAPTSETLNRYRELVFASADGMASPIRTGVFQYWRDPSCIFTCAGLLPGSPPGPPPRPGTITVAPGLSRIRSTRP